MGNKKRKENKTAEKGRDGEEGKKTYLKINEIRGKKDMNAIYLK